MSVLGIHIDELETRLQVIEATRKMRSLYERGFMTKAEFLMIHNKLRLRFNEIVFRNEVARLRNDHYRRQLSLFEDSSR